MMSRSRFLVLLVKISVQNYVFIKLYTLFPSKGINAISASNRKSSGGGHQSVRMLCQRMPLDENYEDHVERKRQT